MNRIIDANLNRATEALRVIEEIARFHLDNTALSKELKTVRHEISTHMDKYYEAMLYARDTEGDVGTTISSPTSRTDILTIFKANFKRMQQALRTLAEYSQAEGIQSEVFEKARYQSYTWEKKMFEELNKRIKINKLQSRKLYLVTDRSQMGSTDEFLDRVAQALQGGVQIIQLREKTANAKEIVELGKKVRELCSIYDALFIINDRVDIAHIVGADGVHLGQDDLDIDSARHLLGKDAIVGISTHCPEQAIKAVESGADYIGVGPVFETPTKPGRKSVGLEYVEWASKNVNIPWYAIGGINTENADEVIKAGATKLAVVRAIINADNPQTASETFISIVESQKSLT